MTDWHQYWNTLPAQLAEDDYLRQVGKTVNGKTVSNTCVEALVRDIVARLNVSLKDSLLDLCCGNGVITRRSAKYCRAIVGVDYSEPLIRIASAKFRGANISYALANVCDLPQGITSLAFDKIYMYEALQHLTPPDLQKLLRQLRQSASGGAPLLLASVPDEERLWFYYDTPARKDEYFRRKAANNEAIGHWWTKSTLTTIAKECGYKIEFFAQNPILHTAHYRFDALLCPIALNPIL